MGDVHHFVPRANLNAAENLAAFIEACKTQLTTFGASLDFEALVWEITAACRHRAKTQSERITFCTLASTGRAFQSVPMALPYGSFARAHIRYQQGLRPTQAPRQRLAAHRVIEQVLREHQGDGKADPTLINADLLNRAVRLAKQHFAPASAYRIGVNIEQIGHFLDEHGMTPAVIDWRNPIRRPEDGVRVGEDFERRRAEKMPSKAALEAMAAAFNLATEPRDVIQSAIGAVLMSVPARIAELLTLPFDCEAGPPPGGDQALYGLRWWPAKGADPQVKWVIPSMVDTVKRAIDKIRRATSQARTVATWYENNPGSLYLPPDFEHLRGRDLELDELSALTGISNSTSFCHRYKIRRNGPKVRFGDVEAAILARLPQDFPFFDRESDTPYSRALFIVLRGQFGETPPMQCMIERISHNQVADGFGSRVEYGVSSLFTRMGFEEPDGKPICIVSHMLRHMLNTMAQKGGASQIDIAKWSGRKDLSQNAAYDHESAGELLARVQTLVGDDNGLFGLPAQIRVNVPADREEYARHAALTAHTTELGFCLHDFAASPCELHMDCLRCTEHLCVKGNRQKTAAIRARLDEAQALLTRARHEMSAGAWGADRWVVAHTETVARLEALLAILEDPALPDGAVIRVGGPGGPSRLVTAAAGRGIDIAPPPPLAEAPEFLEDMRAHHG